MGELLSFAQRPGQVEARKPTYLPPLPLDDAEPITFRVLVADDDEWIRNLLRSYLSAEGVDVETVRNGDEAITRFCKVHPDIVFLDVEMPGSTGLDVLEMIRGQSFDTAVVITTAYGSEDTAITALRRGADDYLRKPFEREDLQMVLDRTIARLLLTRQNATLRAHLVEHQRRADEELARAAAVVAELMPSAPPAMPGFELAAACLSARDVGGDFYDWQQLPSGALSLTVGDVMGKGLPAALLMATVRAVVRALVPDNDPADVVHRTAAALDHDLTRSGAFVTLFHAQVDRGTASIRYVDAGHGYVLLLRGSGEVEQLQQWGLPIGVDGTEGYPEGTVQLHPGDSLVIYSDGLTEARPDIFGARDRVAAYAHTRVTARQLIDDLMEEVRQVRPLPDDLTVVVLRRPPVEAAL